MKTRKVRVRFAPSPTGPLHIGGVRTALFNYLFAKKNEGDFILRIEDTDQARFVPGTEEYIVESLKWCKMDFDEGVTNRGEYGPYRQSERKDIYKKYTNLLIESGNAYYAFDTQEELENLRRDYESKNDKFTYNAGNRRLFKNSLSLSKEETLSRINSGKDFVIRFKIPENEELKLYDIVKKNVIVNSSTLDDKILFKSDGMPTYHFANVVDDHLMNISHVIRGEEWLPSLPLHFLLYRELGWEDEMPAFAHLPLLLKPDGKGKLSKRDGDRLGFPVFPLEWKSPSGEIYPGYRDSGYFPEAFVNMIAFLGWNPGTEREIFSLNDLVKEFSLDKVGKSGAKFNPDKAKWFNHYYLQKKSDTELASLFQPKLKSNGVEAANEFVAKLCGILKKRVNFVSELWDQSHYFFTAPTEYDEKIIKKKWQEDTPFILTGLTERLNTVDIFNADNIEKIFKAFLDDKELKMGDIMNVFRLVLVGSNVGPGLFDIAELLGKDEVIRRIENGIKNIKR
jgi:glutamyl-tRNA synthetase